MALTSSKRHHHHHYYYLVHGTWNDIYSSTIGPLKVMIPQCGFSSFTVIKSDTFNLRMRDVAVAVKKAHHQMQKRGGDGIMPHPDIHHHHRRAPSSRTSSPPGPSHFSSSFSISRARDSPTGRPTVTLKFLHHVQPAIVNCLLHWKFQCRSLIGVELSEED